MRGKIYKGIGGFYYVMTSDAGVVECRARGRFRKEHIIPMIGDADKVIFYNSGAFLTTEGSEALKDLKALEEAGATIMTCGTCLDFYGIKDKLQVGIISNMYDIVEAQMNAGLIIRP